MVPLAVSATREYSLPQASCPSCNCIGLEVADVEYDVENFGAVLMSVTTCRSCGFKHTDISSLTSHEPTATSLNVRSSGDLRIHVIRGSTATVLVPEFGASIEPGLNNEGFVSNVEGVLARIEDVLRFLMRSLKGPKEHRANLVLRKIERAKEGRLRFTLVLKDPFGNSTIVSGNAKRRRMGERELKRLKFGAQAIVAKK